MDARIYEGWIVVFQSGTDYESDLVRDRLDDAGLHAVVLSQRDHAFNLTHGDLAQVRVLTPPEHVEAAAEVLGTAPPSDEELEAAALTSTLPLDTHDTAREALLDSGNEQITLSVPESEDEEDGV